VDFLGGLVPGILFVVATTVALVPVLRAPAFSAISSIVAIPNIPVFAASEQSPNSRRTQKTSRQTTAATKTLGYDGVSDASPKTTANFHIDTCMTTLKPGATTIF
jgi:hypothetical protein